MTAKILIVDDNENMRTTLADILEEKGYKVSEAGDGKQATEKTKKEKPDLILLDTKLPDMNGNEVCKKVKRIDPNVKVIVYTGFIDAVNAGKARSAGADDYVVKTSDFSLLLDATKKLTSK